MAKRNFGTMKKNIQTLTDDLKDTFLSTDGYHKYTNAIENNEVFFELFAIMCHRMPYSFRKKAAHIALGELTAKDMDSMDIDVSIIFNLRDALSKGEGNE